MEPEAPAPEHPHRNEEVHDDSGSEQDAAALASSEMRYSESEMITETPPSALVEPDVPDPFVVDDGEDDDDDDESHPDDEGGRASFSVPDVPEEEETPAAEDEIALAQSIILEPPLNLDKPVPLPPTEPGLGLDTGSEPVPATGLAYDDEANDNEEDDSLEDDEPPELYLPGLILPAMFLPIPNVCTSVVCIMSLPIYLRFRPTLLRTCSSNIFHQNAALRGT